VQSAFNGPAAISACTFGANHDADFIVLERRRQKYRPRDTASPNTHRALNSVVEREAELQEYKYKN
jgi:hypothetical protein